MPPIKSPVAILTPKTTSVSLTIFCLVGQTTFFSSAIDSLTNPSGLTDLIFVSDSNMDFPIMPRDDILHNSSCCMAKAKKITKAIIAVAGYGTRFLPATKNQPKEMLPIIDKPIIQYLVEECVASGITDIIMVTRVGQGIMEDYFDSHLELENVLDANGKEKLLQTVREIP